DLVTAARIESCSGLVEEEDPRAREQARREVQAPAHPAGIGPGGPVGRIGEVEALEQRGGAPTSFPSGEAEEAAEHEEVLAAAEDLIDRRELSGKPEQLRS